MVRHVTGTRWDRGEGGGGTGRLRVDDQTRNGHNFEMARTPWKVTCSVLYIGIKDGVRGTLCSVMCHRHKTHISIIMQNIKQLCNIH